MKLAHTTRFVTYTNDLCHVSRNDRRPTRPITIRASSAQPSSRLIARWHVCPETHRLECSWSLEPVASDDQLCRSLGQRRRNKQSHRYRFLTSRLSASMYALGHKQTCAVQEPMSALPPKADIGGATGHVCFGPIADIRLRRDDVRVGQKGDLDRACYLRRQPKEPYQKNRTALPDDIELTCAIKPVARAKRRCVLRNINVANLGLIIIVPNY